MYGNIKQYLFYLIDLYCINHKYKNFKICDLLEWCNDKIKIIIVSDYDSNKQKKYIRRVLYEFISECIIVKNNEFMYNIDYKKYFELCDKSPEIRIASRSASRSYDIFILEKRRMIPYDW